MKRTLALLSALIFTLSLNAQSDILDARTNYSIDDEVTITGIVTNGDEMGSYVRYIEDGTAGIAIFPGGGGWGSFDVPELGDEIQVTGILSQYYGLLEVGPNLSAVTVLSTGNTLPVPQVITPAQADENLEGELVMIEGVTFDNGGTTIAGNNTYDFTANGETGTIYVRNGSVLVGTLLPAASCTLIGIMSQYSFTDVGGYQLLPRSLADFVLESSINIIGQVNQYDIEFTSLELSWTTDTPGDSKIEWGNDQSLGNEVLDANYTTTHTATVNGLGPGSIYYARVVSSNGDDETSSGISAYATRSESSGNITVYFTQNVNTDYAIEEEAIALGAAIDDTIAAYISRAEHTIDLCIYNFGDPGIAAALNQAYADGIQIRYVGEGTNTNAALDVLNDNIPYIMRTDGLGSGNHNKFCIIDAEYADLATVITGSMNWVNADAFMDYEDFNNLIIFQDQSLARGYKIEFEEMWGGSGSEPDETNSKFGADKTSNTPRKYQVGNSLVESFFSPTDNANAAIIKTIQTTDSELYYAIFSFTRDDIAAAIIDEDDLFLTTVKGLIEQTSDAASEYQPLVDAGMDVFSTEQEPHLIHHKYCIVDPNNIESDPIVLTGSHNWSTSANTINDENTVIVHDSRIANIYYQEFMARWQEVGVENNLITQPPFEVFPNPVAEYLVIGVPQSIGQAELTIFDASGRTVLVKTITQSKTILPIQLESGIYQCVLSAGALNQSKKIIVE